LPNAQALFAGHEALPSGALRSIAANLAFTNGHVRKPSTNLAKPEIKTIANYYTIKTSTQQEFFE
jgi:hypothetical protein